jgi:predicted ferric reductase
MAEDAQDPEDDAAPDGEARAPKVSPEAGPKPGAPHMLLRIVLGTAGLLLVVGFFLPWIEWDREAFSGLNLMLDADPGIRSAVGETRRWILLAIPVRGVALTAIGFMGFRWSAAVAAGIGLLLIGYGVVTVVALFFQTTALGLWLIVAAALIALGAGVIALVRGRIAKHPARELALPDTAE